LVVGNPPWVTNSQLGILNSNNLPEKANSQHLSGIDALTGKSNFDISEWMLSRLLESLANRQATLAMLVKTVVARKVLSRIWRSNIPVKRSAIYQIDAYHSFQASVDACLLVCEMSESTGNHDCALHESLDSRRRSQTIGFRDGRLISDIKAYDKWKHLRGQEIIRWRSGVKHDCAKVMVLTREQTGYRNGLGELVDLEDDFLFPMLKTSELANASKTPRPTRSMLVTQKTVQDETKTIQQIAPKTWKYLMSHADRLDRRASSIYRNRPRFAVFGVGDYSFSPWKVAISGFYKTLNFVPLGRFQKKPIVLDDTSNFIPCRTRAQAYQIAKWLNSEVAREFYSAYVFWDAKRPVTIELLRSLDLNKLAIELGEKPINV